MSYRPAKAAILMTAAIFLLGAAITGWDRSDAEAELITVAAFLGGIATIAFYYERELWRRRDARRFRR
jgi:hypothetical protein